MANTSLLRRFYIISATLLLCTEQRVHVSSPLVQQRHRLPHILQPLEVNLRHDKLPAIVVVVHLRERRTEVVRCLREDVAPGRDDHGVAVRLATGSVLTDLGGREDVALRLDGAGSEEDLPVRRSADEVDVSVRIKRDGTKGKKRNAPCRCGESGRVCDYLSALSSKHDSDLREPEVEAGEEADWGGRTSAADREGNEREGRTLADRRLRRRMKDVAG